MTHSQMIKGSPYYKAAVEHFGRKAHPTAAQSICKAHGTSLEALGVKVGKDGRVDLLTVVLELGY